MNHYMYRLYLLAATLTMSFVPSLSFGGPAARQPVVIRIICSNDTQGLLEPCGCGGRNTGGLVRRATLIRSLRTQNPYSILVDSGNLLPELALGEVPSQKLLAVIARSYRLMGYDAIGLGSFDVACGDVYYRILQEAGLIVLQLPSQPELAAKPYVLSAIGGVRVGVLSFGPLPDSMPAALAYTRARYTALRDVRKECDLLVLLDQSGRATSDWVQRIGSRLGSPDIIVGSALGNQSTGPKIINQTMIVPTCAQGAFVGCVDVTIDTQGDKRMIYTQYSVNPTIDKDPQMQALVDKYFSGDSLLESKRPATKPCYSYKDCVACHEREYVQWHKTPHARALANLREAGRAVPSCLKCHSERYRTLNNLAIGQDDLQAVECASCHSDVLPHDSKPAKSKIDMKTKCLSCHNQERSPNFNYDKYVKLISHKRR